MILMKHDNKNRAVYKGEDKQHLCPHEFPKSHKLRNGYILSDEYLIVKAERYAKKGKL